MRNEEDKMRGKLEGIKKREEKSREKIRIMKNVKLEEEKGVKKAVKCERRRGIKGREKEKADKRKVNEDRWIE